MRIDGGPSNKKPGAEKAGTAGTAPLTPFSRWGARVLLAHGVAGRLRLAWVPIESGATGSAHGSSRRAAEASVAWAWKGLFPGTEPPDAAHRTGVGPRGGRLPTGTSEDRATGGSLFWRSSRSHSYPAGLALGGVVRYPSMPGRKSVAVFLGVDIEPVNRKLHARMAGKLSPRIQSEAPQIATGTVPTLAVWCVKEALFKADPAQEGHILADYDWIQVRRWGQSGWQGQARGLHGSFFEVAVRQVDGAWVAAALYFSTPSQGR